MRKNIIIICLLVITISGCGARDNVEINLPKKNIGKIETKETVTSKAEEIDEREEVQEKKEENYLIVPNSNGEVKILLPEKIAKRIVFASELGEEAEEYNGVIVDKEIYEETNNLYESWVSVVKLIDYNGRDCLTHYGSGENSYGTFEYNTIKSSLYSDSHTGYSLFRTNLSEENLNKLTEDSEAINKALHDTDVTNIKRTKGTYQHTTGEFYSGD